MNNKTKLGYIAITAGIVLVIGWMIYFILPEFLMLSERGDSASQLGFGTDSARAEVTAILEEGEIQLGETSQNYQILEVVVLEGEYEGIRFEVDYGQRQLRPEGLNLDTGDQVIINVSRGPENILSARFLDFVRLRPVLLLLLTFIIFSVLISGWKGVRGLIGMAISILVITYYIIPQIIQGRDPVLVSVTGAFFLLAVSLYLVYGWSLKTHSAVLGTLLSLVLTALLANYFVNLTRLTGFGSEEALFLMQQSTIEINMQGLVLGGMLIGALGVLDDLVITQSSVVFELYMLNPKLSLRELYRRAMRVGQDHVAATVNTLVLAYAGAALPMFLLFYLSGEQLQNLINLEYVAEEIVRTMVGSLGLIAAVPLTTILASLIAIRSPESGPIRDLLGPLTREHDGHAGHSH
jgi:uncharacterized membrane protein